MTTTDDGVDLGPPDMGGLPMLPLARASLPARFEAVGLLREGGMGVVYDAFDRERNEVVALKTMRESHAKAMYRMKREFGR